MTLAMTAGNLGFFADFAFYLTWVELLRDWLEKRPNDGGAYIQLVILAKQATKTIHPVFCEQLSTAVARLLGVYREWRTRARLQRILKAAGSPSS